MIEPFHDWFPDLARRETRSVRLEGEDGIPAGEYFFVESYCTNPDCDCERAVIGVAERRLGIIASISCEFDRSASGAYSAPAFAILDPSFSQSQYAQKALAIFKRHALNKEYEAILKRHYQLVKSAAGASPDEDDMGETSRRGEREKRQRKQQKAARRRNRRQ